MKTKAQILIDAFNEMRINGITVDPDSEDMVIGLSRLESYMHEFKADINYNFEVTPGINSVSGLPPYAEYPIAMAVALRLAPVYGKLPDIFIRQASSAISNLLARVANPPRVSYPSRQPMGRGNERRYPYFQFFPVADNAPVSVDTKVISINDVHSIKFDFGPYFNSPEVVQSYLITPESGVQVSGITLSGNVITASVKALNIGWQVINFKVSGSLGSIVNRAFNIQVVDTQPVEGAH